MPSKVQPSIDEILEKRIQELPAPVRAAISSADTQKRLRTLADNHKLHLDQWEQLENQVMLTLLGFFPIESLADNIAKGAKIDAHAAKELALQIGEQIFDPIRERLERELEHPQAHLENIDDIEVVRREELGGQSAGDVLSPTTTPPSAPTPQPIQPGTPPPPKPATVVSETPAAAPVSYKPGEPSTARKTVHDDPYREPIS